MTRSRFFLVVMLMVLLPAGWISTAHAESTANLVKKLSSQNVMERRDAARQLGKMKDPALIQPLIQALKDPEPMVRLDVSGALIDMGAPVVDPLIQAIKGETHTAFLWNAIRILDTLGDPKAIEPLQEIAKTNPDPNIQQVARQVVERLQRVTQSP
jgi:HEAT repeat protein